MKALKIEKHRIAELDIENTLEALQAEVDGYIEAVTLVPDQAVMIVNGEGVLRGMSPNPSASLTAGRPIFGNALVVGVNGDEFTDIPDDVLKCIRALIGGYKP